MKHTKSLVVAFLAILALNACEKENEPKGDYHSAGKFSTRIAAETEALKILSREYATLPASGYYKLQYEFDDAQLPAHKIGTPKHAIWYDKGLEQLAVEFDIHSGTSCRWEGVDQSTLQKIIDSNKGLEAANQFGSSTNQQSSCFQ